jgi:serine/threonine-protein kinase HipA
LLTVYLDARPTSGRRKVGRLAFKDRQILFEYDASFITSGIEISPIKLPLRPGVSIADTTIFDGLHSAYSMTVCRTDGAAFCSTAQWKNTVSIAAS